MMESGTRRSNSPSGTNTTSNTTGTELGGRLSRLVLLSLGRPRAHQVRLQGNPMLRLMLPSPLLHLRHLVLLSLGQCGRLGRTRRSTGPSFLASKQRLQPVDGPSM